MSAKNIVVCADGTGNKGGYSPDSNVYKVYKAVDKNYSGSSTNGADVSEQIVFYDNGVGTESNKYLRALFGAFGFGFGQNVRDLYKYLARNYADGDRIYFFGFSRGASTVRACNGMINKCGLVKGVSLRNGELDDLVDEAFYAYKKHKKNPKLAQDFKNLEKSHGAVPIKFLGVWDTVVALGFPKRTDITGPGTFLFNIIFGLFEEALDLFFPHSFYHYKLTDNVQFAYQALSIDDERTAFWPYVWQEKNIEGAIDRTADNVEQVWFAGMHSNVGGGYERAGMAGVALHWMVNRAQYHDLVFDSNDVQDIYSVCHIHGRMYDSRDGLGFFYRYHPREIENLCEGKLLGKIKLHGSVINRLKHRTANYVPGHIPGEFEMVDNNIAVSVTQLNPGRNDAWWQTRKLINKTVLNRKRLYELMLTSVIFVVVAAYFLKDEVEPYGSQNVVLEKITDFLYFVLPDFFNGLINVAVVKCPYILAAFLVYVGLYIVVRTILRTKSVDHGEELRHYIIHDK